MSIALIVATSDRIVAASDSRARDFATGTYFDGVIKIDIADRHVFAATGEGNLPLAAWRATPPIAGESAKDLAARVLTTMEARLAPHEDVTDVLFGVFGFRGAAVDAYALKVRVAPGETRAEIVGRGVPDDVPFAMMFGWDDQADKGGLIARQILPTLKATPAEDVMVTLARHTIDVAARQSHKVGGETHVAILDAKGSRWTTK